MTIQLLQHAAQQEQPFFLRWDPSEPHLPNVVPEPYASMYPPAMIPPWPNFVDELAGKPYIHRQQRRTWGIDDWTWAEWAPIVGRYLGEITLLDSQIGRVLATLEELGLAENTLVIYSADHGDLCGSHGMIDKHYVMYEELVRVPLIIRWPSQVAGGQTVDAFVSSEIDLAATICDCAACAIPTTFAGQSTLPLISNRQSHAADWSPRQDIFTTYYGNQFGLYSQRMVRDEQWKYVWNATAEDELYDTIADPGELQNLATKPEWQSERLRLRQRIVRWMQETNDQLLNYWTKRVLDNGEN
ncbi:MAG: sulfatase-like hydrolase/transferase [Caldilineaceae bacterium]